MTPVARRFFRSAGSPRFPANWVVMGLGNPGAEYARHRHNVGFWVVDELARRTGVRPKVTGSLMAIAVAQLGGVSAALVKPRTYVNRSGEAARQALAWTSVPVERLVVVHDDLDLPVGALRIRSGGGHGGHNGLKSIIAAVGPDFVRVRIGIGRPEVGGAPTWDPDIVADYVLSVPPPVERELLQETAVIAADAVEAVIAHGVAAAAARFNRRGSPPPSGKG